MIDFNLDYYRVFLYVAKLGTASKAADALCLSQTAITRTIKLLETNLGCQLFHRTPKGMVLTDDGEAVFKYVSTSFDILTNGESELMKQLQYDSGTIKIGATETAIHYFLPVFESFKEKYPQISIHLEGSSTPDAIEKMRNKEVDLALAVSPVEPMNDIAVIALDEIYDIFVCGEKFHKQLGNRVLSAPELAMLPLITVKQGTSARNRIDEWFRSNNAECNPAYSVITSSMIIPFVKFNMAVGIIPRRFVSELLSRKELFELRTDSQIPPRQILLMHSNESTISRFGQLFIDYAKTEMQIDL